LRIEYDQTRSRHHREGYTAQRGETQYEVAPTGVEAATQQFIQVVELPQKARNVQFHAEGDLPERYRHSLQNVR
jgi:hypothetical protein